MGWRDNEASEKTTSDLFILSLRWNDESSKPQNYFSNPRCFPNHPLTLTRPLSWERLWEIHTERILFILIEERIFQKHSLSCVYGMTRSQMMVSNLSHGAIKNLTDQRMHLEGPKISLINSYNQSFQEMSISFRRNLTVWQGKLFLWRKNTTYCFCRTNLDYLAVQGPVRQTVDIRSTYEVSLETLGYNGSNELCGRSVASKFSAKRFKTPIHVFNNVCTNATFVNESKSTNAIIDDNQTAPTK